MIHSDLKPRNYYLDRIKPHIGNHLIKLFTGLRRSGKSYLMLNLMEWLEKTDQEANIIYINKELYEFDAINDYHSLQAFFDEKWKEGFNNYFFVDEVQEIDKFEKCIRNVLSLKKADIYLSGSNAEILSGELATLLSGRYIEIKVYPLSYPEFLDFFDYTNTSESFLRYHQNGGMPGLLNIHPSPASINDYLNGILSTVILKDVVARHNIRNVSFLENLIRYLADNVGSLVSAKNVSDFLKSQKVNVSPNLVLDYLSHLSMAFIICKVPRMEISGKKIFEIGDKFYFTDNGLRNVITGFRPDDLAKLLENTVYNHLVIAGYKVNVGKRGDKEIDFVAQKNGETIYVQVCLQLSGEKIFGREFGNLLAIPDNYLKYVVSLDSFTAPNTYKGIEHMKVADFCIQLINPFRSNP